MFALELRHRLSSCYGRHKLLPGFAWHRRIRIAGTIPLAMLTTIGWPQHTRNGQAVEKGSHGSMRAVLPSSRDGKAGHSHLSPSQRPLMRDDGQSQESVDAKQDSMALSLNTLDLVAETLPACCAVPAPYIRLDLSGSRALNAP
jgi:hypothetical protein